MTARLAPYCLLVVMLGLASGCSSEPAGASGNQVIVEEITGMS
jgi:hypothetical protein